MVWKVRRTNQNTGQEQIGVDDYATASLAFDAMADNVVDYIKTNRQGGGPGSIDDPPADNTRFKTYWDFRNGGAQCILRWDYVDGNGPNTNEYQYEVFEQL